MEGGGGGEVRARSGRRRITLLDQMSAIADGRDLSGLTLDDILRSRKQAVPAPPPPPEPPIQSGRTLLDIIRDEDPKASSCQEFVGNRDRKSWRSFKDRLRLKRTGSGAAWTSSVPIPASDILSPRIRSQLSRRGSVINSAESAHNMTNHDDTSPQPGFRQQISLSRRGSCRFGPNASFASDPTQTDGNSDNTNNNNNNHAPPLSQAPTLRHQISRRHSTRYSPVIEDSMTDPTDPPQPRREGSRRLSAVLAEERSLSAREAVAAQEAAEAAAAAAAATHEAESTAEAPAAAAPEAGQQPVRMSLMDLLEETDRQMGFVGSRYMIGDDEEEDYEEEEEGEEDAVGGGGVGAGGVEQNCCVCMVRHKGAAFIPCGHTFCRLCSRELWVSRGNCPLCNGFILEILDIF